MCEKCGLFISRREAPKAFLRHQWRDHREDVPKNLRTLTEFLRWCDTEEGKNWVEASKQPIIIRVSKEDAWLFDFYGETHEADEW
jgi:hypothetical protein